MKIKLVLVDNNLSPKLKSPTLLSVLLLTSHGCQQFASDLDQGCRIALENSNFDYDWILTKLMNGLSPDLMRQQWKKKTLGLAN